MLRANLTLKIVSCFRFVSLFNVLISCICCNYMKLIFFCYIHIYYACISTDILLTNTIYSVTIY